MHDQDRYEARTGLFARWGSRLAQAMLREPHVILLDRDAEDMARTAPVEKAKAAVRPSLTN